ncbi:MAG: 3-oxoacyl-ACP reductase FabG [Ignavibacteriales bacterium]|nr:3-oxoacyl-ACP reductase FabG [Ignavibacteriales bacterium]
MITVSRFKHKNKVAIVTGSGRRLGRAIAIALAENGFDVVVNYYESKSGVNQTIKQIKAIGRRAFAVKADISNKSQVQHVVNITLKQFGRIDLLVNNSSIFIESPLTKTSEKNWDTTIDINLKGTFLCSQAVAPIMLKQKSGRIINIVSLGGLQAWTQHLPYSVSKAGVIMLTKILAKTLAPHIQVNAIAPGTIQFEKEEDLKLKHLHKDMIPLKKYGEPSDITDMIVYLATKAGYITGQVFHIDGGRSIQ